MDTLYFCKDTEMTDEELPASTVKWAKITIDEDDLMDTAMADFIESKEYLSDRNAINTAIGLFRSNLTSAAQQVEFTRVVDRHTDAYANYAIRAFDAGQKPSMDAAISRSLKQDTESFMFSLTSSIQKNEFKRIIGMMVRAGEIYADKAYEARSNLEN